MKHNLKITLVLIAFFLIAQIIGLSLLNASITVKDGVVSYEETSLGPRPEMSGLGAFAYVLIGVAVGTALVLLIIKLRKINLWKAWFFLAVFIAISLAMGVIIKNYWVFVIALALAILKIYRPNIIIHNLTEVLMYSGIALFLAPMLNVFWVSMLLIAISIYDFIAVFQSKHMVKMAEFQTESKVFAGLFIPYTINKDDIKKQKQNNFKIMKSINSSAKTVKGAKNITPPTAPIQPDKRNAVLGGGDIAFPLIFTGVVMESLISQGLMKTAAFQLSFIITITTTLALASLFFFAKKDKFYPAMPVISAGCFIGYGIILLLGI